jgi:hypothetical protein
MKTLLSAAESARDPRDEIVLSYFFNARGEALERSTEGLYRSLLHQITAGIASLPEDVIRWSNPESLDLFYRQGWQIGSLKGLLKRIVLLDRRRHLWCFIDALDEGDNGPNGTHGTCFPPLAPMCSRSCLRTARRLMLAAKDSE